MMKTITKRLFKSLSNLVALTVLATGFANAQNMLQFTSVNTTPEKAIQLHWASNSNEVYEIDYADSLIDTNTGTITWNILYEEYPSHGTNTFVADAGNYDITPTVTHPKNSPMRFYRVMLAEGNTSPVNPTIAISYPTNGATLSGTVNIQVATSSPELITQVRLYIDGEEQYLSNDHSNFVVNTCEWLNGNHTLFATTVSQSGLEGILNTAPITYGRTVSSYMNMTFDNLISEIGFSQPYFEPALGQTQQVTAIFGVNCDWTLNIVDASSNTVRTAFGTGTSMEFDWDGTGTGETNIPDGVYNYVFSAVTNSTSLFVESETLSSFSMMDTDTSTELYATDGTNGVTPLALYPPNFDTNGLTIFPATKADIQSLRPSVSHTSMLSHSFSGGGFTASASRSGGDGDGGTQSTKAPTRKPNNPVKGVVGSFGICLKTYSTNGFASVHPETGFPFPLPTRVAIDGQSRTAVTVGEPLKENHYIAREFAMEMKKAGWKMNFFKENDAWGSADIKKASLGGNSIFNTCNFGWLLTHGSYGVTGSTGTEADGIRYTYVWLGSGDTVRLSDMDFGSSGTEGLRWMTLAGCNLLRSANFTSMNNAGIFPVNANLHCLIGNSTDGLSMQGTGIDYADNLVQNNQTIYESYRNAMTTEMTAQSTYLGSEVFKAAIVCWPACFSDRVYSFSEPDPDDGLQYQENQVYP